MLILGAQNVFAHSDSSFPTGWTDGINNAMYDTNAGNQYNSNCPDGHSISYCNGYVVGYNHYWYSADHTRTDIRFSNTQGSDINIKGDNNRVTVNQQSNQQVGDNGGGGSGSGSGSSHSPLPRCVFLCAAIKVN